MGWVENNASKSFTVKSFVSQYGVLVFHDTNWGYYIWKSSSTNLFVKTTVPWYLKAQLSCSNGEKLSNSAENFQTWQKECQEVPPGFLNPAQTCQAKVIDHFNTHTEQKLTKTCHILQEKKVRYLSMFAWCKFQYFFVLLSSGCHCWLHLKNLMLIIRWVQSQYCPQT